MASLKTRAFPQADTSVKHFAPFAELASHGAHKRGEDGWPPEEGVRHQEYLYIGARGSRYGRGWCLMVVRYLVLK